MGFKVYNASREEDEVLEKLNLLQHNTTPFLNIDLSQYSYRDKVGLIDGDWLAYSVCCSLDENDEFYVVKGRINQKIEKFIKASGCNHVIVFCGSTGNYRLDLPLPKRINTETSNSGRYKDNRKDNIPPNYLNEAKHWLMTRYRSWWAVDLESDDCIVLSSVYLTKRGVISYIFGIDKDYNQIHGGGLAIEGHQDEPTFFENTPENRLGFIKIQTRLMQRPDGTEYKVNDVRGHGDKFLVYQALTEDVADNYSCKNFMKNNFNAGSFGDIAAIKYINQATTLTELWDLYLKRFTDVLPEQFEYECWDGTIIKSTPFEMADLYFKCACMMREQGVIPDLKSYMEGINDSSYSVTTRNVDDW